MSPRTTRLHRSELAVPGSNIRMLEKAPDLGADIVMLDLEDAVAPEEKEQARTNVIGALRELDWSRCSVSLRINGLDTHYCYRDLVDVVERAGHRLDSIMIPKASGAADVQLVATLLARIEDAKRLPQRIAICVLIETALGMVHCEEIARACPERMEAMVFGVADYAASIQSHTTSIGGTNPDYAMLADPEPGSDGDERELHLGDQWHYALARIALVCRAYGLRPIDGPFGDFTDPEGYLASARRAAVLGYEGKWAIHPSQIELANEVFTPSERIVEKTHRIIAAMQEAAAHGEGAVSLDGRLIDAASIRMAENLLATVEQIEARDAGSADSTRPRLDNGTERGPIRCPASNASATRRAGDRDRGRRRDRWLPHRRRRQRGRPAGRDPQWTRANGADTFCQFGPGVTTAHEIPDAGNLRRQTSVDGALRQDSDISYLIFGCHQLVELIGQTCTVMTGYLISPGPPSGVGMAVDRP
jgi:malyl-CoA/(S)-citramalyl-CoA lyase